jgi:hypothetical protein
MFVELATSLVPVFGTAELAAEATLTSFNSTQLADFLEQSWAAALSGVPIPNPFEINAAEAAALAGMARFNRFEPAGALAPPPDGPVPFHHLIYAFALENTRMVEIFRRVITEFALGERLSLGSATTQRWAQVTEELFFTHPRAYSIRGITSDVRPNHGAVRRNAYYRVLGFDLSHGQDDGSPYPYPKAEIANREFSQLFEALLREVWLGFKNRANISGENATDDAAIEELLRRLREMLSARRLGGALAREEFDAIAMLSWFHLTILFNTAITNDLRANASGAADRLRLIGQKVALAPHSRADAFIQLAQPLSIILRAIEFDLVPSAASLYFGPFTADMLTIITQWSIAVGQNLKDATLRVPVSDVVTRQALAPAGSRSRIAAFVSTP